MTNLSMEDANLSMEDAATILLSLSQPVTKDADGPRLRRSTRRRVPPPKLALYTQ